MAAAEERLLSEGEGGAPGSARLSPPPLSQSPEAPAPLEQPPQSNTLMGLPIVAIESILSFLSYDETSQLRLVGAGEGREGGRGAVPRPARGRRSGSSAGKEVGRRLGRVGASPFCPPRASRTGVQLCAMPAFLAEPCRLLTPFIPFVPCKAAWGCWSRKSPSAGGGETAAPRTLPSIWKETWGRKGRLKALSAPEAARCSQPC